MKQEEKELLEKYLAYRKKRNKIILGSILIFVVLIGITLFSLYLAQNEKNIPEQKNITQVQDEVVVEDTEKPIITLKAKQISIYQNDTINYSEYIESAIDNKDGNITQNIKYNTIDTSQIGEFEIIYSVQDEAKNEATEKIQVIIIEKKDENTETASSTNSNKKENDKSSSSNNTKQQNSSGTTSTQKSNKTTKTKDFLFADGYDMNTVSKAANDYIDANGGRGEAYPIRDDEGIIIGMRVKIY